MKNVLLVFLLLGYVSLCFSQSFNLINHSFDPISKQRRELYRYMYNNKGQMYYDVSSKQCAFLTLTEFNEWNRYMGTPKEPKLKLVNNQYSIYFHVENDTFKIDFKSKYYKHINDFYITHDNYNDVFYKWDDMTFRITELLFTSEYDNYISYYGYRDDYLSFNNNKPSEIFVISIVTENKNSIYLYILLHKRYIESGDEPIILFKVRKSDLYLNDDFHKINNKYIYHKYFLSEEITM